MIKIENLLKNLIYEGKWGNLIEPRLELKTIDVKDNCLYLKLARDYSTDINYRFDDIEKLIPDSIGIKAKHGSDFVCYLQIKREELVELVSQVVIFCLLKQGTQYKNVKLEENDLNSNIGKCCYTMTFDLLSSLSIPIDVQLRRKGDIDDLDNIYKEFAKYAKELGIIEKISSDVMKEKGIVAGDINNLCECFDYDVIDEETVILHLKNFINPKYLLRFKGFNNGYTDFKIWTNGHNGTFTMVRGDDYYTIQWGNSTTCCSDYYWDMQRAIMECIRIKKLMF